MPLHAFYFALKYVSPHQKEEGMKATLKHPQILLYYNSLIHLSIRYFKVIFQPDSLNESGFEGCGKLWGSEHGALPTPAGLRRGSGQLGSRREEDGDTMKAEEANKRS